MNSQLLIYKVIIVGQSGVGKSNLVNRYANDRFQQNSAITIGAEFISKILQINHKMVNLQIWDTAGQQRYRSVNKFFYKNAIGGLVVFSLDWRQSFDKLSYWLKQIREELGQQAILILVGNKCDLKERTVSVSEAAKFAKEQNMAYLQTSAALNINVTKAFDMLTQALVQNFSQKPIKAQKQPINIQKYVRKKGQLRKKKKCCQ